MTNMGIKISLHYISRTQRKFSRYRYTVNAFPALKIDNSNKCAHALTKKGRNPHHVPSRDSELHGIAATVHITRSNLYSYKRNSFLCEKSVQCVASSQQSLSVKQHYICWVPLDFPKYVEINTSVIPALLWSAC